MFKRILPFLVIIPVFVLSFQNCSELSSEKSSLGVSPVTSTDTRDVKWQPTNGRTYISVSSDGLSAGKNDSDAEARRSIYSNVSLSEGKYFWEVRVASILSGDQFRIGVASVAGRVPDDTPTAKASYGLNFNGSFSVSENGNYSESAASSPLKLGDVVGVSLDLHLFVAHFYLNGALVKTQNIMNTEHYSPFVFGSNNQNAAVKANFGKKHFIYPIDGAGERLDNSVTLVSETPRGFDIATSAAIYMQIEDDLLTVIKNDSTNIGSASAYSQFTKSSGKWYFEGTVIEHLTKDGDSGGTPGEQRIGIASTVGRQAIDGVTGEPSYAYTANGKIVKHENGVFTVVRSGLKVVNETDTIGVAADLVQNTIKFYVNGTLQASTPIKSGQTFGAFFHGSKNHNGQFRVNFGTTPFKYKAPAEFYAPDL